MPRSSPRLLTLLLLACCGPGTPSLTDESSTTTADPASTSSPSSSSPTTSTATTSTATTSTSTSPTTTADPAGTTVHVDPFCEYAHAFVTSPRVMLVLDKSGSMVSEGSGYWDADNDDADDDGFKDSDPMTPATPKITRWQSLYETVDFIVTDFEERMDFGAVLFPSTSAKGVYSSAACPVNASPDVPIGADQGATILATIPPAGEVAKINGGTPATAGMLTGIAGLATDNPDDASRPKYVILVTDGAANCPLEPVDAMPKSLFENYDTQLPVVVGDAFADMIPTFVVGIDIDNVTSSNEQDGNPDNTNTYDKLNELAIAGGQARDGAEKFYNTANQVELQAALMSISETITSCTFDLSQPINDNLQFLESLIVDKGGTSPLVYDKNEVTDCATESGWRYTAPDAMSFELCGAACDLYRRTGELEARFGCESA